MIFYFLLIALIIIYKASIHNNINIEYMSIRNTTCIKGIFILLVFYRHIASYVKFNGNLDFRANMLNSFMGQLIVTMFLFYSGYGVFESIKKKKQEYINEFPVKRILKVLIEFDIVIILFWIVNTFFGKRYGLKQMLLTFIGWDGIGNSNWYIFCILITYTFTYIGFKVYKNSYIKAITAITILTLFFIGIMSKYKEGYWYNTVLCYPAGMWVSYYKAQIEELVLESKSTYLFSLIITIGGFKFVHKFIGNILAYEVWSLLFVVIVVIITMKISIHNSILHWLGSNLFELYMLQRIPMIVFKNLGLAVYNKYLYFIVCFLCTGVLALMFKKLISNNINKFLVHNRQILRSK